MLQRAASNAYSWWWASNIRTKQSKWLESNLQEMEEKMKTMIKLIEVDADSFAKKAEMYYQRRPELIKFVEETYKAYKALADRYDRLSGELHKANHTLASAFPDQFQFAMQDDDEYDSHSGFTAIDTSKLRRALPGEVPQINLRRKSPDASSALKKHRKDVSCHVTKESAQDEVDTLQKEILVLQTEKEFVKGSYESVLAKFWEIENRIADLQVQICTLQDECGTSSSIEDDEARALMAVTAINSCKERLVILQQQQKKSGEEAGTESKRIREANNILKVLKDEKCSPEMMNFDKEANDNEQAFHPKDEDSDLFSVSVHVKQQFKTNSITPVIDLAEKIDELVEKIISLEVTVLSQMAQMQTLRSETDGVQKHLRALKEDKANLITDSNSLVVSLQKAEDELHRVQELEKAMYDEKTIFQTHFIEAYNSLNDIIEKLQLPRHEKDSSSISSNIENLEKNVVKEKDTNDENGDAATQEDEVHVKQVVSNAKVANYQSEKLKEEELAARLSSLLKDMELDEKHNTPDWHQLINNGSEGRQNMVLNEYMLVLQNYKDTKERLADIEKKDREYHFDMMAQIQDLKDANADKDREILDLRRKLFSRTSSETAVSSLKQGLMVNNEGNGSSVQVLATTPDSLEAEEEVKLCQFQRQHSASPIEEKFRAELDTLLDENLDFWLRFSTSYHHIQKFEASFKELQEGLDKLKDSKEGPSTSPSPKHSSKLDTTTLDKKMRAFHTELQVWLERNDLLKGELQCRFASLCNIQEEISRASSDAAGDGAKFTQHQAAQLQGELLNMQHENNKVAKELQTGLDHVNALRSEAARSLSKLRESFDLSVSNEYQQYQNFRHCSTMSKIPLRTFLFGEKRMKPSVFSCISPAVHENHSHAKPRFSSR